MKTLLPALPALILLAFGVQTLPAESQIKLTGRKDLVLSFDSRVTVLDVARQHLSEKGAAFVSQASEASTPFAFEQPVVVVVRDDGQVEEVEKVEEVVVNYDDASVLRAVSQNFAKQVRGTIARGATSFLQLNGGSMVKPGTSFPVSIPQAQGQTFTVTITAITTSGYTLQLGEATQTISINATGSTGAGAIKFD